MIVVLIAGASSMDLEDPLAHFAEHGWARLGHVASDAAVASMRKRAEDIMLGVVTYPGLFFQHDTDTGRYGDLKYGRGYEGPSLRYRKIEKVEKDPIFRAWIDNSLFERVARACIGPGPIAIYRALLFAKAEHGGTTLPWHQDGGVFWGLDRDPTLQIWTALDDAPEDAGCVEVFSGSQRRGLATPLGGVVPENIVRERLTDCHARKITARAGEAILIHNHLWHRSGVNTTARPRRALTICYMSANTRCLRKRRAPRAFVRVFDQRPSTVGE
ncbi:MAG: phytanoyl-CoA dioxygenase family protein [Myxococcota bacterium]|nr:phytanoyl-CoA dioxygenase family protein [Myxococcota bacterium]